MLTHPDVTVIGTIVFDIFIPNVNKIPSNGQAVNIDKFPYFTGGCGSNTSIILARCGSKVSLIGSVGNDLFGDYVISYLRQNNVDTSLISRSKKFQTSTSILLINKKGERSYFHSKGSNKEIKVKDSELEVISKSKIFHIGGANLLPSIDGKPMAKLLRFAKSKNVTTSVDLAWDTENLWLEKLKYSLNYIDILMGNKDEILSLSKQKNISDAFEFLHTNGVKIVVCKVGAKGSIVSKNSMKIEIPSFKIKSIDSTGAGDAFAGGFLFGLLSGKNLYECGRIGNYFGALATTEFGSTLAFQNQKYFNLKSL